MIRALLKFLLLSVALSSFLFAQSGVELLQNSEFDDGLNEWSLVPSSGGAATMVVDSTNQLNGKNSTHVTITKQGAGKANWEIAVIQNLTEGLKVGKMYYVTYQAKVSVAASMDFWVKQSDSPWGLIYNGSKGLTTTSQTFVDSFTVSSEEANTFFAFALGAMGTVEVWIDNVHIVEGVGEVTPPKYAELLKNNTFDSGLDYWESWPGNGAEGSVEIDDSGLLDGDNSAHIKLTKAGANGESWEFGFAQGVPEGVKAGKQYIVKYTAKASEAVVVEQKIQEADAPWGAIFKGELVLLDTTAKTFIDSFTVQESRKCNWVFALGAIGSTEIWIDDIHLLEMDSIVTDVEDNLNEVLPASYSLYQNYPNPFNPTTVISFSLMEATHASISIYNTIGQKVMEVTNSYFHAGTHSVNVDASSLTSGIYLYKLETPNYSKTMKMMLLK